MRENNKKTKVLAAVLGLVIAYFLGIMTGSFLIGNSVENELGAGSNDDDFHIYSDAPYGFGELPSGTLSEIEAKELGVAYVSEMFEEDIDATSVIMYYDSESLHATASWNGQWRGEVRGVDGSTFHFTIDAVSGERISALDEEVWIRRGNEPESSEIPYLSDVQRDIYKQSAREYAQKHFSHSNVEVESVNVSPLSRIDPGRGSFIAENLISLDVIDSKGRLVSITLDREFGGLLEVSTGGVLYNGSGISEIFGIPIEVTDFNWGEPTESDLSAEQAAEAAIQFIQEEFGENIQYLEGVWFQKTFFMADDDTLGRSAWNGTVKDAEGANLFHYVMDGQTGEILEISANTSETPAVG